MPDRLPLAGDDVDIILQTEVLLFRKSFDGIGCEFTELNVDDRDFFRGRGVLFDESHHPVLKLAVEGDLTGMQQVHLERAFRALLGEVHVGDVESVHGGASIVANDFQAQWLAGPWYGSHSVFEHQDIVLVETTSEDGKDAVKGDEDSAHVNRTKESLAMIS